MRYKIYVDGCKEPLILETENFNEVSIIINVALLSGYSVLIKSEYLNAE